MLYRAEAFEPLTPTGELRDFRGMVSLLVEVVANDESAKAKVVANDESAKPADDKEDAHV